MIYLASPYSHNDPVIVALRMQQFAVADAALCMKGFVTVSPLSKHWLSDYATIPITWEFWKTYSTILMENCTGVFVLMLDGWEESTGVQEEITLAKSMNKPITYLTMQELLGEGV